MSGNDLLKKRAKEGAPAGGLLGRKKPKTEDADADEEFMFDAKNAEDVSIEEDGEVSSEHSDKEIDLVAFAKFCKENPVVGGEEEEYDSAEDDDFDSQEDSEGNPVDIRSSHGSDDDSDVESFDSQGNEEMGGDEKKMSGKDLKEID